MKSFIFSVLFFLLGLFCFGQTIKMDYAVSHVQYEGTENWEEISSKPVDVTLEVDIRSEKIHIYNRLSQSVKQLKLVKVSQTEENYPCYTALSSENVVVMFVIENGMLITIFTDPITKNTFLVESTISEIKY